ncbi:MAG: hypothetical protein J6D21_02445 [Clostridia bacterium]|nr:hypothetical protein [Clostridia bacterium]
MKWIRELWLCLAVGILTLFLFAITGQFYVANEHSILTNTFVWLFLAALSYFVIIFIPYFQKKAVRYIDLWAFASGLLSIMLYCLSQAKSIDEYSYLSVLSYIAGILSVFELLLRGQRNVEKLFWQSNVNPKIKDRIINLPLDVQNDIYRLATEFEEGKDFKLTEAALVLKKSERRTRKIVKEAVAHSIIVEEGNTSARKYRIVID